MLLVSGDWSISSQRRFFGLSFYDNDMWHCFPRFSKYLLTCTRTQELATTRKVALRQLLTEHGETFEKGRAYYQLTKPETIQDYKEIIVRRKADGELITGT